MVEVTSKVKLQGLENPNDCDIGTQFPCGFSCFSSGTMAENCHCCNYRISNIHSLCTAHVHRIQWVSDCFVLYRYELCGVIEQHEYSVDNFKLVSIQIIYFNISG